MKSQHLSCRARHAYRLLATCLLAGGGVMAQASTELTVAAQKFRSLQEAPIRAKWQGGTVTASFERVPDTDIQYLAENEIRTMKAKGAPLLTIEVRMNRECRAANYFPRVEKAWKCYDRMADEVWQALSEATKTRKREVVSLDYQPIDEAGQDQYEDFVLGLAHALCIKENLWDQQGGLFLPARPEVCIIGKYTEEFLLARAMQKQYFSRPLIQGLQAKMPGVGYCRKNLKGYQEGRIRAAPDTVAKNTMLAAISTFVENHQKAFGETFKKEASEKDREKAFAPLFDCLLPMVVYTRSSPIDIPEPRGRMVFVNFAWSCWQKEKWPDASIVLPAKAIGRGYLLFISAAEAFLGLLTWKFGTVIPTGLIAYRGLISEKGVISTIQSMMGRASVSDVGAEIVVVCGMAGLLAVRYPEDRLRWMPMLARLAWSLAGLAATFEVVRSVWEVIHSGEKPVRNQPSRKKSKPYSPGNSFSGALGSTKVMVAALAFYLIVMPCFFLIMPMPSDWPFNKILPARAVFLYQQMPDCCIRRPDWKDDLSVSLGGYLGIGLWLLLTIVSVRVTGMVADMQEG